MDMDLTTALQLCRADSGHGGGQRLGRWHVAFQKARARQGWTTRARAEGRVSDPRRQLHICAHNFHAARADDIMLQPGKMDEKVTGSGAWKSLLSTQVARLVTDTPELTIGHLAPKYDISPLHASNLLFMASHILVESQKKAILNIMNPPQPHEYLIVRLMADESSFRVCPQGEGPGLQSIQNTYCSIIWRSFQDQTTRGPGPREEHVICAPACMANKTAACSLKALFLQLGHSGMQVVPASSTAQFVGLATSSDAGSSCEKLFEWLHQHTDDTVFTAHKFCMQHACSLAKTPAARVLDVATPLFCIAKQLGGGPFMWKFMGAVQAFIDERMQWIRADDSPDKLVHATHSLLHQKEAQVAEQYTTNGSYNAGELLCRDRARGKKEK